MEEQKIKSRKLRILFVARDKFPPFRVDVSTLFGEELVGRGHSIDWLLQSEKQCDEPYCTMWSGGEAWVGATNLGETRLNRFKKQHAAEKFTDDERVRNETTN